MARPLLLTIACVSACVLAPAAHAHGWAPGACGLPARPLVVDFAEISVAPEVRELFTAAQPPLVLATSGNALPAELRGRGAHTVYWEMNLKRLVGTTVAPADPATVPAAADRLYDRAVAATGCTTPAVALNELNGAWLATPWSPTNAQYRANTLELVRRVHERGGHAYLLVPSSPRPFTVTADAAAWWKAVAEVADVVLEVHFNGRVLHKRGALEAGRKRRAHMRGALAQFAALGIPHERLGLLHGFQSGAGSGGREGLPLAAWLRVVKWEVLATRQVLNELSAAGTPLGSDWSWGWGDFPALSRVDRQKPITACVFLWARHPSLCDGPGRAAAAGVRFNTSLDDGRIWLRPNVACASGSQLVPGDAVARFAAVAGGSVGTINAIGALVQRTLERRHAPLDPAAVALAEQQIVAARFGGDGVAYAAALAAANADLAIARHVIGEQLRRRAIAASLPRRLSFERWSARLQRKAMQTTVCAGDVVPPPQVVDLTRWLPFLALP